MLFLVFMPGRLLTGLEQSYNCSVQEFILAAKGLYVWYGVRDAANMQSEIPNAAGCGNADEGQERDRRSGSMFRLWAKVFENNHMIRDTVIGDDSDDTRTHKVFRALEEVCYQFDLGKPIWLDSTIQDFKRHDKTRFTQDNFIETIDFDYLEIHVIEED